MAAAAHSSDQEREGRGRAVLMHTEGHYGTEATDRVREWKR